MASPEDSAIVRSLLCRVRERLCSLPLEHVVETMRPLPVECLAGAPPFVCGVSIIRGAAIPVVDMGILLGTDDPPKPTRFVTIRTGRTGENQVALSVEEVLGVRELAPDSLRELPPLLGETAADVVYAIGTLDTNLLFALQAARIVPDSVWQAIRNREIE